MNTSINSNEQPSPSTQPSGENRRGCGRRGRRGGALFVLVIALTAGAIGGFIGKSHAHGPFGGGMGAHMAMGGPIDPAKVDSQVDRMIKHFAVEVDASAAQRDKLAAIAKGAAKDLLPLRDKLQAAHTQAIALAGGQSVDRAAMEALRAEQMTLADTVSKRVTLALADAAEVLTPAQRQKLAEHMKQRAEHRPFWRRG
ncbi:MAG: Spy/CpxP family protein refolding chaperone [Burkholderiales bacterium]